MSRKDREAEEKPARSEDLDWQTRLSEAMASRALSGGELARRTGFTSQYVNSLRQGDRGARLPEQTARKLAHALGVSVDWLVRGDGPRERLSDVYPAAGTAHPSSAHLAPSAARAPYPSDVFPSRAEAIALLSTSVQPEVIAALREVVPDTDGDPGRDFWIDYAKDLSRTLRRIKDDPDFGGEGGEGASTGSTRSGGSGSGGSKNDHAPRSSFAIKTKKR